ncbi:GIY-YIG nuclease family protein [Paenibacillus sp. J2TS4]|uniref:GIY-YIG nuclease family protein n=1 Tax=Paenibacillus sp. J2TS4 TaxID=2807194 RepID=UPI001B1C8C21|nr:GIY-YIG nuclease family protein [Paenibacillus sp. J2TS4]GIP31060.1 hypothetical protein J2TS4_02700 [Paenibacillus sp. J2TS4]
MRTEKQFVFDPTHYPEHPGCYLMKNTEGLIIYIGKAKNLRNRLRSYFYQGRSSSRHKLLVEEIAGIEVILVHNEAESLLLENNLIKRYQPKYNRALKRDNSGYAYLKLTDDKYPRLEAYYRNRMAVRGRTGGDITGRTASRIFGPYANMEFRNSLMAWVAEHYQLRTCDDLPRKVCLHYHLGKCSGICEGKISEEAYSESVRHAERLLALSEGELLEYLRQAMTECADKLEFEKAQKIKKQMEALERMSGEQIVDRTARSNQDVIYLEHPYAMVLCLHEGMVTGAEWVELPAEVAEQEACRQFIQSRYSGRRPDELVINQLPDCGSCFTLAGKKKLTITVPRRGIKLRLLELCRLNYNYRLERAARGKGTAARMTAPNL